MGTRQIEVVASYKSALQDLTFNSKPLINVLTMLAEENTDNGLSIVEVICGRIKEVGIDQKMPSLYLLDSILKNIGGDYVRFISICIVDIFCHVFENAKDEKNRMSLFKLRKTWTQYIPAKTLHELDVRSNKTDPNWPIMTPADNSQPNPVQQNKIHVNPKFLQASQNTSLTDNNSNSKNRQIEEEKRLQNEKIKKEREAHEMILKKKQIERERVLADQKRQIDLLKKQQQTMTQPTGQVNTIQQVKKDTMKDPRLKILSPEEKLTGKWGEKINQTAQNAPPKVSPKPTKNKNPISVVNKIMNNLSGKKPVKATKKSPPQIPKPEKIEKPEVKNWDGTYVENNLKKTETKIKPPSPIKTEPLISVGTVTETSSVETSLSLPTSSPFSAAFSGLSSRDMQIAAQAAAIATAMHQMQSTSNGPLAPEQSAQFAAQFISKLMQGNSQSLSLPTNTVTVTELSSSSQGKPPLTTTTSSVLNDSTVVSAKETVQPKKPSPKQQIKEKKTNSNNVVSENVKGQSKKNLSKNLVKPNLEKNAGHLRKDKSKIDTKNVKKVDKAQDNDKSNETKGKIGEKSKSRKEDASDKLEPPVKKTKDAVNEPPVERSRKARARSPSRYYCQIEQKIDSDKRVEKKEKELSLQRKRKNSEDDSVELDSKGKEQLKIYKQFIGHIEALEKRYKAPKSTINVATLESVFKQIDSKFRRKMMSGKQYTELVDKLDAFATQIAGKTTTVGKRCKVPDILSPNKNTERYPLQVPQHNIRSQQPGPDGPVHFHPRGMPAHPRGPPRFRESQAHPYRRGPPPAHLRGARPGHMMDVPPRHMMEEPPPHMIEGPTPHIIEGSAPHMIEGPPPHMMEGQPARMMKGPPPHMMEGPPPHMMERSQHHMMERPKPHMMDGPQHRRDMPPQHFIDGPPHFTERSMPVHNGPLPHEGQLPPPHLRDGVLPPRDGPQPHLWERHGDPQWRDSPPPRMIEGGSSRDFPRNGPPEQWQGAPFLEIPPHHRPQMMGGPPLHRGSPNMMERGSFDGPGPFQEPQPAMPHPGPEGALDVNNILGQLMAFGVIKPEEPEIDEPVPEMPLKIEDLKRRHRSIIKQLFLGMQCSSCGERFPESHKQQYSDHLDWHFRENKKEKEGVRKVSSRSWYYDLPSWIEFSDLHIGKDGKVKSAFFELEKGEFGDIESGLLPKEQTPSFQSVPVEGDKNDGNCGVCMDPLEEYWDEELEEWRYKNAVREDDKTFHVGCFKDYVPYEFDESITPATTPGADKTSPFALPEDENPFDYDESNDTVKKELDEPVVIKTETEAMEVDENSPKIEKEGETSTNDAVKLKEDENLSTNKDNGGIDNVVKIENDEDLPSNENEREIKTVKLEVNKELSEIVTKIANSEVINEEMKKETDSVETTNVFEKHGDEPKCDCPDESEKTNTNDENDERTKVIEDEQRTDDIKVEQADDDYMEDNADSPEFPIIMSTNSEILTNIVKSEEPS